MRRPRGEGGNAAGALGGNPGRKVEDVPDGGVQPMWRGMDCPRGVELDEHCARHASVLPGMPAYALPAMPTSALTAMPTSVLPAMPTSALTGPPWLRQGRPTVDMETADGWGAAVSGMRRTTGTGQPAGSGGRPE